MADMQIVVASKNVEAQYVEMRVPLYSNGCEKKVKKSLSHLKGIYSVKVDYNEQKVTVWGICNKYDVLATVRSKRKDACFWNNEDNIGLEEEKEEAQLEATRAPPSPPAPLKLKLHLHSIKPSLGLTRVRSFKPSLALTRVRSLSLNAWNKVFTRSYSFS